MSVQPVHKLRKVLGVAFGIAIVVGSTIGVGILRTPGSIAALVPSAPLIMACWVVLGLYILLCAASYAELTAMLPKAGGAYNYIKYAFGNYAGFLNGWLDYICNITAPAYFCIVISEYAVLLWPAMAPFRTLVALAVLTLFTAIHLPGVKGGAATQQFTSALKVLLFLVLVVGCFASGHARGLAPAVKPLLQGGLALGVIRSLQLIMGTYDGWMSVSFFAEENEDPGRSVPRAYLLGALMLMIIYVLINAAILYVLPVQAIASSPLAASDAAAVAFGKWSASFMVIISLFSLLSILNAYMMIPARILFGLARDGFFVQAATRVNKGGTPWVALAICYVITAVLIIVSSFEQLFTLAAFMMNITTAFTFASLIVLRRREPLLPRPYRAWGYPFSTWLSILVTLALLVAFAVSDTRSLLIVLGMIAASYPLYKFVIAGRL